MPKKDFETRHFDLFRELMTAFPAGQVVPHEEPDFLIACDGKTIGVEITELHRESKPGVIPQQAREAMRHRIVKRAQEIYESKNGPLIKCAVLMRNDPIPKSAVEGYAQAIVDIVFRNMPHENSTTREEFTWTNRDYFPEFFLSVHISRYAASSRNLFEAPAATWVGKLSANDIRRASEPKEAKYDAYRRSCDEAWLVITSDFGRLSTWFEPSEEAFSTPLPTRFQRVFLLRQFSRSLHEIPVYPIPC